MAFRRFKKRYEYKNDDGRKAVIPSDWAGELSDKIARDADKAGATYQPDVPKAKAEQPKPDAPKT